MIPLQRRIQFVGYATVTLCVSLVRVVAAENDEDPFAPEADDAPTDTSSGPELGLRLGLTTGSGEFEANRSLHHNVTGMLPLWVDAGYRFYDRWFVGVFWQYGLGLSSATSKAECTTCVHSSIKYGIQVNYSFLTTQSTRVWSGLGVGHQSFETVDEETKRGTAFAGWEPISVHLGSSWRPTDGVELGPFFSWSYSTMGSKSNVCYEPDRARCPAEEETSLPNASHIWWSTFGIRAVFLP